MVSTNAPKVPNPEAPPGTISPGDEYSNFAEPGQENISFLPI